jgi:hypothetical protein
MVDAPSTSDLRAALDDVALLGPFYAATANPAEVVDDSWRPLRALYTDPEPLAARIDQVAVALGTEDQRVAASITYQGLAARLVSPLIALAAVHGLTATWSPDTLHWRRAVTGPWPLWESDERPRAPLAVELPDAVAEALVEPHLVALAVAVRAQVAVSSEPCGATPRRRWWRPGGSSRGPAPATRQRPGSWCATCSVPRGWRTPGCSPPDGASAAGPAASTTGCPAAESAATVCWRDVSDVQRDEPTGERSDRHTASQLRQGVSFRLDSGGGPARVEQLRHG